MKFELDYLEKLVKLAESSDLTEVTLKDGDKSIIIKKELKGMVVAAPQAVISQPAPTQASASQAEQKAPAEDKRKPITSPMVGSFYKSPSPNAKPFVELGDSVAPGQVVCIIEAMKLMNEIESEVSGRVVEICVEDGQPVEFGQVIMYVE